MKTLIENGRTVAAAEDYRANILIEDATIYILNSTRNYTDELVVALNAGFCFLLM